MKMQKAEMEFVTFDAQDVIATSGGPGWLGKNMYTPGSVLATYGGGEYTTKLNHEYDNDHIGTGILTNPGNYYLFSLTHDPVTTAVTGLSNEGEGWTGLGEEVYDDSAAGASHTENQEIYYLADEVSEIIAWIQANDIH